MLENHDQSIVLGLCQPNMKRGLKPIVKIQRHCYVRAISERLGVAAR